ncbi:hypothetical protein L1049_004720 [Liquidambar formosana]|uniref:Uncharacterized protein n=1 Tax=Liquidambar formosana TaxID=63359 RepID=A0AAP0WVY5_LIQFO
MGSEKNGRKNDCNVEDEQEEEKIEKFFALIKSFRDARNRRRSELKELEEEEKKKIRKLDGQRSSWVPSFKWEDFTQDVEFRRLPLIFPTPCNSKKKKDIYNKEEEDEDGSGLDLKLAL